MKQSRRARLVTALIALVSVLFIQLAAAAYACPGAASGKTPVAEMAAAAGHMAGCDEMTDNGSQTLCFAQSQEGKQSLNKPAMPDLSQQVPVLLIPAVGAVEAPSFHLASPHHVDAAHIDRAGAPPLTVRNCCFRI